jgi:hypothetical protein
MGLFWGASDTNKASILKLAVFKFLTEGVREQGAEEVIRAEERWGVRRLEKTT